MFSRFKIQTFRPPVQNIKNKNIYKDNQRTDGFEELCHRDAFWELLLLNKIYRSVSIQKLFNMYSLGHIKRLEISKINVKII